MALIRQVSTLEAEAGGYRRIQDQFLFHSALNKQRAKRNKSEHVLYPDKLIK